MIQVSRYCCLLPTTASGRMTGITERKFNPEQSDCNISQDDRSYFSLPNKAESMSHLFLCLPGPALLATSLFNSTTAALLRPHYRNGRLPETQKLW